jgi:hypothetical protein
MNQKIEEAIIEWTGGYSGVHRVVVRPEVAAFAIEMEAVLRENDHKSGWDDMSAHHLFNRIKQEYEELQREYILACQSYPLDVHRVQRMRAESIDVANFCMFLCYNYPKTESPHK